MARSTTTSSSQSTSTSSSVTKNLLDEALLQTILGGLSGQMSDEEITAYAENLLRPVLNAELEASQQGYETTKLSKEQEIENLVVSLQSAIEEQKKAYGQNMADVETSALSRGMGRSSYLLDTQANLGRALAEAVQGLTDENTRQSAQIQQQITQAAQQHAQTTGRLNTDYATNLAAKVQELKKAQQDAWNSNYLTAVSSAMGQQTTGTSTTTENGTSTTVSSSGGSGSKTNTETATNTAPIDDVDVISMAAPSVRR